MIFLDANVIYEAMHKTIKSSDKDRYVTQLYQVNHLLYTAMLQEALRDGTYKPKLGNKFVLSERGKTRFVTNNKFDDKVINHVICDEILTPALKRFLIHDNGASQKGKGVSFTDSVSKNTCLSSTLQTKDLFYSAIFQVTMQISGMINVLKFWRIS